MITSEETLEYKECYIIFQWSIPFLRIQTMLKIWKHSRINLTQSRRIGNKTSPFLQGVPSLSNSHLTLVWLSGKFATTSPFVHHPEPRNLYLLRITWTGCAGWNCYYNISVQILWERERVYSSSASQQMKSMSCPHCTIGICKLWVIGKAIKTDEASLVIDAYDFK